MLWSQVQKYEFGKAGLLEMGDLLRSVHDTLGPLAIAFYVFFAIVIIPVFFVSLALVGLPAILGVGLSGILTGIATHAASTPANRGRTSGACTLIAFVAFSLSLVCAFLVARDRTLLDELYLL